jgi:Retrotransposon gag protein/Zinc knuckle
VLPVRHFWRRCRGFVKVKSDVFMSDRTSRYLARRIRGRSADQEVESPRPASNPGTEPSRVIIQNPTSSVKMPPSFRIKYTRFKGDGSQDVDDWMEQYLATLAANAEGDEETTKRLFRGVIEGEALKWYGTLDAAVKNDWPRLQAAFEQEFREIGADSQVMARLSSMKMEPADTLRSYTQRVHQLVGKLSTPPPANLQLEWFISGLPELLDFEVRKSDPQTLLAAIDIAKKYEKSALLSGRWAAKKKKKKVRFEESEDSDDFVEERESQPVVSKSPVRSQLTKIVKDEMQTLRSAIEEVKVQMADIKKSRRAAPPSRTNIWCARCKKEGHYAHDCQADWRMIYEEEGSAPEEDRLEMESLYAIQQGPLRTEMRSRPMINPKLPGTCWECGEVGHYSPSCPNKKQGEYIYLCSNCREEGHKASLCPKPLQVRIQPRYVQPIPREQSALNWANKTEQPEEGGSSNVRWIQEVEVTDVRKVSTRSKDFDRRSRIPVEEIESSENEPEREGEDEPVQPVQKPVTHPVDEFQLPDVSEEVLDHLVELQGKKPGSRSTRTTVLVSPELSAKARRDLHYNIMQDIEKRLAEVTIGQLLRDSPKYRKQVLDAVRNRRRRRLPPTITDVRFTEVEDWGAPEIDAEIDGCMVPGIPVDGGSGVNVIMEQTAVDLGFTTFESTPKILRMANQEEVVPIGKLSQVLTRMGDLEYNLNYVVIRLPIPSTFQVLLGRPWLYKAGVLEDWKRKEFRIGSVKIPWQKPGYHGETAASSDGYTDESEDESEGPVMDCWMVVNAFKSVTEEDLGFQQPEEVHVNIVEAGSDLVEPEVAEPVEVKPDGEDEPVVNPVDSPPTLQDEIEREATKKKEDNSLGSLDVPLTTDWVQ